MAAITIQAVQNLTGKLLMCFVAGKSHESNERIQGIANKLTGMWEGSDTNLHIYCPSRQITQTIHLRSTAITSTLQIKVE